MAEDASTLSPTLFCFVLKTVSQEAQAGEFELLILYLLSAEII